jgi:acetyl esterase/lipase
MMPLEMGRRDVGLGLLSLFMARCTTRSAMPVSDSTADPELDPTTHHRKLKILCLHGYHGSGRVLRSQMAAFAASLESLVDFVFIDAPSLAAGDYGWWHAVDAERDRPSDDPGVDGPHRHYEGWARTRDAIVASFGKQGPFDGILGFSQGAALAGLLVGLRAAADTPTTDRPLHFDFAILIGGFPSNDLELARLYERHDAYDLPSLHVVGRSDGIVPIEESRSLAAHFVSPVVVEHAGGHVVASEQGVTDRVRAFLGDRIRVRHAADERRRDPIDVPLWNGSPSPAMRVVFPASRGPAPALVVFRGGAYSTSQGSGGGAAEWAAANGMVGVEVDYRTQATGDAFPKNYADAARAVRLVRARAGEWSVDPARVGVLGFSAGGHLASLLGTQPDLYVDPADDLAPRIAARPDFVLLAYPLISFVEGYSPGTFVGSAENFVGRRDLDEDVRRRFSNELHVVPGHPPVFLWTTADDALVPAAHSERFAEACKKAGVSVTLEIFPHGPHGMGLALHEHGDVAGWTRDALAWLVTRGVLEHVHRVEAVGP